MWLEWYCIALSLVYKMTPLWCTCAIALIESQLCKFSVWFSIPPVKVAPCIHLTRSWAFSGRHDPCAAQLLFDSASLADQHPCRPQVNDRHGQNAITSMTEAILPKYLPIVWTKRPVLQLELIHVITGWIGFAPTVIELAQHLIQLATNIAMNYTSKHLAFFSDLQAVEIAFHVSRYST